MAIPKELRIVEADPALRVAPEYSLGEMRIDAIRISVKKHADSVQVLVPMRVPDVRAPHHPIDLVFTSSLPRSAWDGMVDDERAMFVRQTVLNALGHELDEWFQHRGVVVNPPRH